MGLNDVFIFLVAGGVIFLVVFAWIIKNNHALRLTTYQIKNDKLPASFHRYRIIHLSDIHNIEYDNDNQIIMEQVKKGNPDGIVITGDLLDSRKLKSSISLNLILKLVKIAPVYYVTGNHESRLDDYESFELDLKQAGVNILRDEALILEKKNETIQFIGIDDPDFDRTTDKKTIPTVVDHKLQTLKRKDLFTILLIHRPDLFEVYVKNRIDLVLAGHTHGGQIRIPFIGGIMAPDQGFFPKYDAGLFQKNGTSMIISKGVGDSSFPFRVNDNPEVVLIVLNK